MIATRVATDTGFLDWVMEQFPDEQEHSAEIDEMIRDVSSLARAVRNEGRQRAERELRHKFDNEARSQENALLWLEAARYLPVVMMRWVAPQNRGCRIAIQPDVSMGKQIKFERHIFDSEDPILNARLLYQLYTHERQGTEPQLIRTTTDFEPVYTRSAFGGSAFAGVVNRAQAQEGRRQGAYLPVYN